MGTAKKFLALSVSFLCFVFGLLYLFDALRDLHSVEAIKITWVMEESNDMNMEVVKDGPVSGSKIVALVLLPLDCEVELNGNEVTSGNAAVTTVIDMQKKYWLKREYNENLSKPTLLITEYVEE